MNNSESANVTTEPPISVLTVPEPTPPTLRTAMKEWNARQRWAALIGAVVVALGIGLPTDVIPNPVFGRPVPVTWWSYPVLVVTAVLGGLLIATYVRVKPGEARSPSLGTDTNPDDGEIEIDPPTRQGTIGGLLSFFAVGCPVCNKLVVVALGTTGARQWFEPMQPVLAVGSIVLLGYALRGRIGSVVSCRVSVQKSPSH